MEREEPTVIGFAEYVDFPKWGIVGLRGKIDTGARTSALHVSNIRELPSGRVGFDVRLHRKKAEHTVHVEARLLRRGRVRPSTGDTQTRLFVLATLRIGTIEREVELSLVDREKMIYRMLVGRSALGAAFVVDPSRRYVLTRKRPRRPKRRPVSST
ncbi:MAG TPA: RimK/LysX family protein [Polyangiaceae bacterium]|nr:RimK/LysX family protein [Polyangiaceae bacterium]